ncbi:ABC-2 type transport system permease protein [Rhodococcus wratislaviensis]|uniref:Anibiotic ABC transporter efflux pump n=1 Tax=Rhodococcus wratislaviensis TaxID=44752 RepID=A0AB38FMR2_RHOWR|nr:anibiotic ABC transporter [Rhodococcus wratislaviensis]REE72371.1 ABC-2 type transport system permease protein [Rhodococcus wratislaviensis]SPZ42983.1 anibiotic ABC transporter efflux pump [Rhodococcus wratislaviensis]
MSTVTAPATAGRGQYAGTVRLVRLALRRDRIQLPVWLLALAVLQAFSASSVLGLYPTVPDLRSFAMATAASPVALATNGLVSGYSAGAVLACQIVMPMSLAACLMTTLLVVRHTRQNEETGRAELVEAAVVGRKALLTAALAVAVGANLALGLLNVVVLMAAGLPLDGSVALGAAVAGAGIAFAAIAAVTAQVTDSARTANGLAGAALGVAFLLRAVGDMTGTVTENGTRVVSGWPTWVSPIGWAEQVRPYDDNAWWVLALPAVFALVVGSVGFALTEHRDVGSGLVPTRPGPARASRSLPTAVGSAWRMQRTILFWWAFGIAVLAVVYGAIADQIDDFLGEGEQVADMMEQLGGGTTNMVDAYFAAIFGMMAIAVAGYAVQALLRMRGEESAGRLEPVLATAVSRPRWILAHVGLVTVGIVVLQALTGAATGLAYGLVTEDVPGKVVNLTGAALVFVPAIGVVAAVVVLAFGGVPAWSAGLSWGALAVCLIFGFLGSLLGLPQAVRDLSPFTHVPPVPAAEVTATPLLWLAVVAVVVGAVGVVLFRRRDLTNS